MLLCLEQLQNIFSVLPCILALCQSSEVALTELSKLLSVPSVSIIHRFLFEFFVFHGTGVNGAMAILSGVWWWMKQGEVRPLVGLVLCVPFSALTLMVW